MTIPNVREALAGVPEEPANLLKPVILLYKHCSCVVSGSLGFLQYDIR